jgi:hypothetical protein
VAQPLGAAINQTPSPASAASIRIIGSIKWSLCDMPWVGKVGFR